MTEVAPKDWWEQAQAPKNKYAMDVHTPDPKRYHNDAAHKDTRMVGATMIPRANADGTSQGFRHKPSVVIIDPEYPGSVVIDHGKLKPDAIKKAMNLIQKRVPTSREDLEGQEAVHHAYSLLGQAATKTAAAKPPARTTAAARSNPTMPGVYVTPQSNNDGRQFVDAPVPEPEPEAETGQAAQGAVGPVLESVPTPPAPPKRRVIRDIAEVPEESPVPEEQPQPGEQTVMSQQPQFSPQMVEMFQLFLESQAKVQVPQQQPSPVLTASPQVKPALAEEAADASLLDTGIPFLSGAPRKPTNRVIFELGAGGTISTRYHAVVKGADCLLLVYDNRYQDSDQYIPPAREETFTVRLIGQNQQESLKVAFIGFQAQLGCLDILILVLEEPPPPSPGQQMQTAGGQLDDEDALT